MQTTNNDSVKNLIQIRKSLARGKAGNLAENKAFLDFLRVQAELNAQIDETWKLIQERMLEFDIQKIDGEWGYITMAERKSFAGTAAPRFMKKVLDTTKVSAFMKLHKDALPEGVTMKTSKYLAKRITV